MYKKVSTDLDFKQRELETIEFWNKNNVFERSIKQDAPVFTFFDGPPTANGKPHIRRRWAKCKENHAISPVFCRILDFSKGFEFWTMKAPNPRKKGAIGQKKRLFEKISFFTRQKRCRTADFATYSLSPFCDYSVKPLKDFRFAARSQAFSYDFVYFSRISRKHPKKYRPASCIFPCCVL